MNATAVSPTPTPVRRRTLEVTLSIVAALAIVLIFWSQQRYPSLLKKLHSGQSVQIKGGLSFDALLPVNPQMPAGTRVLRTSVNWLWTNRFGMYFAIPFGAAAMTLLSQSSRTRRFASPAGNVLCGAVAGMPLGVCANCATPIGQGLLDTGASTRMAVATMVSSPMFNPVVIAMSFVLFPAPLAGARLAVAAIVLALLPWIVPERTPRIRTLSLDDAPASMSARVFAFARSYLRNLFQLLLQTLPWMLLAAVMGALLVEAVPAYGTHLPVSALGVVLVALLGTVLPVPMAFDVALAFVLSRSGVPTTYVAALLCTLGPVSIYSLSALGQQLGRAVPLRLAGTVAGLGCFVGWLTLWLHPGR